MDRFLKDQIERAKEERNRRLAELEAIEKLLETLEIFEHNTRMQNYYEMIPDKMTV